MWLSVVSSSENRSVSSSRVRVPTRATTMAPADDPDRTRGSNSASSKALTTPRWKAPNEPPPESTSAVRPNACLVSRRKARRSA